MLDEKTEMMLRIANLLTAEELDQIRATAPTPIAVPDPPDCEMDEAAIEEPHDAAGASAQLQDQPVQAGQEGSSSAGARLTGITQGEIERRRTRESKIATECVGRERARHEWWTVGTELVGRIGSETFTGIVVENPAVKSGRSIRITSGAADGRICKTPTRAALEATEHYRQTNNLGRAGGVTNGWEFWMPA